MTWTFVVVAVALILSPGADFALIVRNTLSGGRSQGAMTVAGVSSASAAHGLFVTVGLAGVVVRVQPLFLALKWAGVVYLAWLAFGMLRTAVRGDYPPVGDGQGLSPWVAYRQGFLCNATNPKILVFYLSLLSQFVAPDASWMAWLAHAWTVPFLGTIWCLTIVLFVSSLRRWLQRRAVRRAFDAASGVVLTGFCVRLAMDA